jgi:hypothetical protein
MFIFDILGPSLRRQLLSFTCAVLAIVGLVIAITPLMTQVA